MKLFSQHIQNIVEKLILRTSTYGFHIHRIKLFLYLNKNKKQKLKSKKQEIDRLIMNNKQTPDSGFTKLRDMTIKELSMQMVKD